MIDTDTVRIVLTIYGIGVILNAILLRIPLRRSCVVTLKQLTVMLWIWCAIVFIVK